MPRKKRVQLQLPDAGFIAAPVRTWTGKLFDLRRSAGAEFSFPDDPVLNGSPLANVNYATLFTYMHRRFGLPHRGGDDYKDLSAAWILSTPEPDVFLRVSPSFGAHFSFTPYVSAEAMGHELELTEGDTARVIAAYRAALLDLLRPVCVRDSDINALGLLGDDPLSMALLKSENDEEDESSLRANYAESSGYPMPLGFFGGEDWPSLIEIVSSFGDGDLAVARKNAILAFRALAFPALRNADWGVQRLVLLGAWAQREDLIARAGLPADTLAQHDAEFMPMKEEPADMSIVSELTDKRVEAAKVILKRLGLLHASHIDEAVDHYRYRHGGEMVGAELSEALGNGDVAILVPDRTWISSEDYLALLRSRGNEEIIAWAERSVADKYRRQAFTNVAWNLFFQAEKEAKANSQPAQQGAADEPGI